MQKLHLVGFTTDHRALILSARRGARSGRYVLELDGDVATVLAEATQRAQADAADQPEEMAPAAPPRPQSALPVRELQARLRAGRSVEDVAAEAGVEPSWVDRFAVPIVAERRRVVEVAQGARLSRARLGASSLPLGAAVRRNLADRGVVLAGTGGGDGDWAARHVDDGRWLVTLRYAARGRKHTPTWELDIRHGELVPRDRLAAELGYVPPAPAPPEEQARPGRGSRSRSSTPTDGERASSRRVGDLRREATAQLHENARTAAERDAAVARRAAEAPPPPPSEPPTRKRPAATKKKKEKKAPPPAAAPRAAKKKAAAKKAAARPTAPRQRRQRPAPLPVVTAEDLARAPQPVAPVPAPAAPADGDAVAAALAAVRRELEQELSAFEQRRARADASADAPTPAPPPTPAPSPVAVAPSPLPQPAPEPESLPVPPAAPPPSPVFRPDVVQAAAGNGAPPPARPRRRQPLRAR